jgi:hypothetical protein
METKKVAGAVAAIAVATAVAYSVVTSTTSTTGTIPGPHVITATAFDAAGNSSTDTVTVEVYGVGSHPTTLTIGSSKSAVYLNTPNYSTLLTGKMYSSSGTELTLSKIYVWKYIDSTWSLAGPSGVPTDSMAVYGSNARQYQFRVAPTRTTKYQFRFDGDSWNQYSTSPTLTIPVWQEVK